MIKNIITRATVDTRLGTGRLGSHLTALATRLQNQRYATSKPPISNWKPI